MKEQYTSPIIEVIEITTTDVITTSDLGSNLPGDNEVGFGDL